MADLQSEMRNVKSEIDRIILGELLPDSSPIEEINLLYKMMRDYPSRPAKGMRPFLCVTTCRAAGGTPEDALLTAACIELFQHWILIHDDIEDASELRRGEPALHRRYGGALALNAGDALHARMWGTLTRNQSTLGPLKTVSIMEEFSRMVDETTQGQHMELSWVAHGKWNLTESDYFEMCRKKTSWYTVAGPCRLGAIVAGAPGAVLERLKEFGLQLGIAFQIQDDALNLIGDQVKYGKEKSDDILEGKRTLIILHLLENLAPSDRTRVIGIMNKCRTEKTPADVAKVLSLVEKTDSVGYARKRAVELMKDALKTLSTVKWTGDKEAAALLVQYAKFAVEREW